MVFWYTPSSIDLYSKKIIELINNVELSIQIGKAARVKVKKTFDIEKNAQMNIDYYNSFIK